MRKVLGKESKRVQSSLLLDSLLLVQSDLLINPNEYNRAYEIAAIEASASVGFSRLLDQCIGSAGVLDPPGIPLLMP